MLFDLQADPAERHNVAGEFPDVVKRLKRLYDQMTWQATPASSAPSP